MRWQVRRATSSRLAGHVLATGAGDPLARLPPLLRPAPLPPVESPPLPGIESFSRFPSRVRGSHGRGPRYPAEELAVASHARPLLIPFFPVAVPRDGGAAFHLLAVRGGPRREIAH